VRDRDVLVGLKALMALVVLLLVTERAPAYVGPGAGLEFIGYFSSLLAVGVAAFSTMLLWPVYALINWLRRGKNDHLQGSPSSSSIQRIA
jgi:hypothetical protein